MSRISYEYNNHAGELELWVDGEVSSVDAILDVAERNYKSGEMSLHLGSDRVTFKQYKKVH